MRGTFRHVQHLRWSDRIWNACPHCGQVNQTLVPFEKLNGSIVPPAETCLRCHKVYDVATHPSVNKLEEAG